MLYPILDILYFISNETKLIKFSIVLLLSPIDLWLTSTVGQNVKENMFKGSKTYFSEENVLGVLKCMFVCVLMKI